MFNKKRGQVTVFIIIGIIILLAVGIFFYITTQVTEGQLDIALKQDAAEGDSLVVQNYVSQCLQETATDAVVLLGQGGGYINLSRTDIHQQTFQIREQDPTASDAVSFGTVEIPYWWYQDSSQECSQCSITTKNIPTIETMEEQISVYVAEHIEECFAQFESLQQQGFTVTPSDVPLVETAVAAESVYIQLVYPVTLEKEGVSSTLENWYTELAVPLQKIYDGAVEIVSMEVKNQFLEQIMLNIITAYSGIDEERLPPLSGFTEGYAIVYWVKQNVKEQLGKYLTSYIPLIQVQGANAAVPLEPQNEYGEGFFSLLYRDTTYSFGTTEVNFIAPLVDYNDYYLDITPAAGELLQPMTYTNEFLGLLPPVQTNHYSFYYDVSYPVIVSLHDATALQGEGFTFFIAMEANIRDNKNLMEWAAGRGTYGAWDATKVSIGLKEGVPTTYPSGINIETNETIYSTYEVPEQTLICDAKQRISGTIEVTAYDSITQQPIPNAAVSFRCGTYSTCMMGATNTQGEFISAFPVCIGGAVLVNAEGYYPLYVDLDTTPAKEDKIIALLEPTVSLPVTVQFIPASRLDEGLGTTALRNLAFDMGGTDTILLTFEKKPTGLFETVYTQVITVTKQEPVNVTLVSGSYTVTGLLLDEKGVVIPARNETISGQLIEYPEVNMTPAVLGQVFLDANTGLWEVDAEKLQSAESVTFYLFRANDPQYIEDLSVLGEFGNYSLVFRDVVEPNWE